ncbi:3'-5' ssDNA/RNA exonuclease TatD [Lycorma delicatula]|uniref:3'-5' ssDNA/RNA exonuclease TatD n=1 Tax=Lycorma delicatula TaxID=130591 RepID=UPI003F5118D8
MASATAIQDNQTMKQCYENYILIDAGANLTNKKFGRDLESVIQRAKDAGVQKMIVPGSSLKSSRESLRLARIYPDTLYSTAGVHPHDAKSWNNDSLAELKSIAECTECVAIGECGLDYNRDFSPPEIQQIVFEKQIELACDLKKPLFIHERDAHDDVVTILSRHKDSLPSVFLHSFTGNCKQAKEYIDMGIYIGITGSLCKDNTEDGVQALLETGTLPLDHLLVETDSPFLYPNARASKLPAYVKEVLTERSVTFLHRYCTFQRNEPCSLPAIVEMVAAFLHKSPEDIALATAFNALKVFGLT